MRSKILLGLLLLSGAIALYRGVIDAGGWRFGWHQGYDEPLNSLRLGKCFLLALLVSPLLKRQVTQDGPTTLKLLSGGLVVGLTAACLAALWERAAFPGVLDFSSDYRTTALFWEMHVGGAALDGFLALTLPFAIGALLAVRGRLRWLALAAVLLLATYVCLTTFSRGVYLAVAVTLGVIAFCHLKQRTGNRPSLSSPHLIAGALLLLLMVAAMQLVFQSGGYRAMLAVLAVVMITLPLGRLATGASLRHWLSASALAIPLAAMGITLSGFISKGPYLLFGIVFLLSLGSTLACWRADGKRSLIMAMAIYLWLVLQAAGVAWHWGGNTALQHSGIILGSICLLLLWQARSVTTAWPATLQAQGALFGVVMLISGTIAVLSGGGYMAGRFSTSERDMGGRLQHWSTGLSLLHGNADWALGKGFGRFPTNYLYGADDNAFPGSYRVAEQAGNAYLVLAGPRHVLGFGELFRISQRVPIIHDGAYSVALDVRLKEDATLHLEVCEKHLLYNAGCALQSIALKAAENTWQPLSLRLDTQNLSGGEWYAPRLGFFSIAVDTRGKVMEIDNIQLQDARGRSLLANGDFSSGMKRWFFTSDRQHLPWHIKNLLLNVLFDQGLLGLLLFLAVLTAALWRLLAGAAQTNPIAPYLGAALVAFMVVGAFDSLLDVPRLAFLFYVLLILGLFLPGKRPNQA
ncbi:hypothetical protein [Chitinimonas naiadis]